MTVSKKEISIPPETMIAWGIVHLKELQKVKQMLDAQDNVQKLILEGQDFLTRNHTLPRDKP
jgi:hypothetical protein